ncbi:MAG: guanylate kinase [Aestuariibacter sp.]
MTTTPGNLFIVAAPSGAGKSSLIKALLENHKDASHLVQVSVSHTTRAPRPGEVDGVHYHFVSKAEFEKLIAEEAFFEWAKAFDNYYGTAKKNITETLQHGIDVFLDIEWQGARQVKALLPDTSTIFIAPPSRQELRNRLSARKQDSEEVIDKRMASAVSEISHFGEFDYIIVNDDFDTALAELESIVCAQRLRRVKQIIRQQHLFDELMRGQ